MRAAAAKDALEIARVHVASWQDAYAGILSPEDIASRTVEGRLEKWTAALSDDTTEISVAEMDSRIVGFVASNPSNDDDAAPTTGEVAALYLVGEAWGRGIGAKLLDVAQDCLARKGFTEATLWVLRDNAGARAFYERRGWREDRATKDCFGGFSAPAVRYRAALTGRAGCPAPTDG